MASTMRDEEKHVDTRSDERLLAIAAVRLGQTRTVVLTAVAAGSPRKADIPDYNSPAPAWSRKASASRTWPRSTSTDLRRLVHHLEQRGPACGRGRQEARSQAVPRKRVSIEPQASRVGLHRMKATLCALNLSGSTRSPFPTLRNSAPSAMSSQRAGRSPTIRPWSVGPYAGLAAVEAAGGVAGWRGSRVGGAGDVKRLAEQGFVTAREPSFAYRFLTTTRWRSGHASAVQGASRLVRFRARVSKPPPAIKIGRASCRERV